MDLESTKTHVLRKLKFLDDELSGTEPKKLSELTRGDLWRMHKMVEKVPFNAKKLLMEIVGAVHPLPEHVSADSLYMRAKRIAEKMKMKRHRGPNSSFSRGMVTFSSPRHPVNVKSTPRSSKRTQSMQKTARILLAADERKRKLEVLVEDRSKAQQEIESLRIKVSKLEGEAEKLRAANHSLKERLKALKKDSANSYKRENRSLKRKLSKVEASASNLRAKVSRVESEFEVELRSAFAENEKQKERFEKRFQRLEGEHLELKTNFTRALDLEKENSERFKSRLASFAEKKLQSMKDRIEREKIEVESSCASKVDALKEAKTAAEEKTKSLRMKLARRQRDATLKNRNIELARDGPTFNSRQQLWNQVDKAFQHLKLLSQGSGPRFRELLEKLISKKEVSEVLQMDLGLRRVKDFIFDNLKDSLQMLQRRSGRESNWKAYQTLLASVVRSTANNGRKVTALELRKSLGVKMKSYEAAVRRRKSYEQSDFRGMLCSDKRKTRTDSFAIEFPQRVKAIDEFWRRPDTCRIIPGLRTVHRHFDATGKEKKFHRRGNCTHLCESHPVHEMRLPIKHLYQTFLDSEEAKAVGIVESKHCSVRQFGAVHRPWFILEPIEKSCGCIYHQQWHLLLEAHHKHAKAAHKDCKCNCEFCSDNPACSLHRVSLTSENLFDYIYCEFEPSCLMGCRRCGFSKKFPACVCPEEKKMMDAKVAWKEVGKFATVGVQTNSGSTTKEHTQEVNCEGTFRELVERLRRCLEDKCVTWERGSKGWGQAEPFNIHRYVDKHQSKTIQNMIRNLKDLPTHMVCVVDFAMNYSHIRPEELQQEFFQHWQTTIVPAVCYRKLPDGLVWAETFMIISPDLRHDCPMVQHALSSLIAHYKPIVLRDAGEDLHTIHCWSDGCRNQFRLKDFYAYGTCCKTLHGVRLTMNYFQSCHGKGMSDSENHAAKCSMRAKERAGVYLGGNASRTAADFLKDKMSWPKKIDGDTGAMKAGLEKKVNTIRRRHIKYVGLADVRRSRAITSTNGPKNATEHYFFDCRSGVAGRLEYGWLSHSCKACMTGVGVCNEAKLVNYRNLRREKKNLCQSRMDCQLKVAGLAVEAEVRRPRAARRTNRRGGMRRNSNFLFCERPNGGVDGDDFQIVLCKAVEPPLEGGRISFQKYKQVTIEGVDMLELDTSSTLIMEVDDVLPPINFRLQPVRGGSSVRRWTIPAGLQQRIETVEAAVEAGEAMYL